MTNPFSLDSLAPSWVVATEILKGDVPGHEFHGNQYTSAGGSFGDRAHSIFSDVITEKLDPAKAAELHDQLAKEHWDAAQKALAEGKYPLANRHRDAAELHEAASGSASDLADDRLNDEYPADETHIYFSDGSDAARASEAADNAAK